MPTYGIGLKHVSPTFATKAIFTDVTQGVFEGDYIGTVGRNSDGKSTLLHLSRGAQEPGSDRMTKHGGFMFDVLDQCDPPNGNATVHGAVLEGHADYGWASDNTSREIVEVLLGGMSLDIGVSSLSGDQCRRADLARLLLEDWNILALGEPTDHLDMVTTHRLAEHLKNHWSEGRGALLFVTHDRWPLGEVCELTWEVHDSVIEPLEGGYSTYMLQRAERNHQADVRETKCRNLARKKLAWLSRGTHARSTKQKFHVKAAHGSIVDVPPMRNTLELRQMATPRLGKQVIDLVDVMQIFEESQGTADIDPDVAALFASASRVDVANVMYAEPQLHSSAEVAVTGMADPHLMDAGVPEAVELAEETRKKAEAENDNPQLADDREIRRMNTGDETIGDGTTATDSDNDIATAGVTSAVRKVTVFGREILGGVTRLIDPGDRFGAVGANSAGKSTLFKLTDGALTLTAGHTSIDKTVKFAVLPQRLDELERLGKYKIKEVLSRYRPGYIVDDKGVMLGQLMERLGFGSIQLMTPIRDLFDGQRRRVQLLLILLDEPNMLIMDEPGNDLDTGMLAVMEDLLDIWLGTLIVVFHGRYLLKRVADQQFALIGGKVRHLPSGAQDYFDVVEAIKNDKGLPVDTPSFAGTGSNPAKSDKGKATAVSAAIPLPQSASQIVPSSEGASNGEDSTSELTGKAFYEIPKRVNAIERKLAKLEEQKVDFGARMATRDPSNYEGLSKLNEQLIAVNTESDDLEAEWLEPSGQLGQREKPQRSQGLGNLSGPLAMQTPTDQPIPRRYFRGP